MAKPHIVHISATEDVELQTVLVSDKNLISKCKLQQTHHLVHLGLFPQQAFSVEENAYYGLIQAH